MPTTVVKMPQLGESVSEGTIGRWLKQPGDRVERDEPLVEIQTDKVNAEVPSPVAGILQQILLPGRDDGRGQNGPGDHRRRGALTACPGPALSGCPGPASASCSAGACCPASAASGVHLRLDARRWRGWPP